MLAAAAAVGDMARHKEMPSSGELYLDLKKISQATLLLKRIVSLVHSRSANEKDTVESFRNALARRF